MLSLAFFLLSATILSGAALALLHLRDARPPPRPIGALHGVLGAAGLASLLLALRGPPRGLQTGVAPFGQVAAWLAVGALLAGLAILVLRQRSGRVAGLALAAHATLAIIAYVMLAAYVALPG
jgi:hypothetical protein